MKIYNIKVNGKTYEVEVEEAGKGDGIRKPTPATQTVAPNVPTQKAEPAKAPTNVLSAGAKTVTAPMPGTVLDIKVTVGQQVKAGDTLLILEAMKMENEIMAPDDGVVDNIHAEKGAAVNGGEILLTLK